MQEDLGKNRTNTVHEECFQCNSGGSQNHDAY